MNALATSRRFDWQSNPNHPAASIANRSYNRRALLSRASTGFGMAALAGLMHEQSQAALVNRAKRFAPKARSVIFLYMSGGVSHVDSFDHKPMLKKFEGKPMPGAVKKTQFNNNGTVQPSHWDFKRYGQSGLEVSDLFPQIGGVADDLCMIRSMTAKFSEHAQGNFFMHTGFPFLGNPSAGAWTSYGLGTESRDLPGYVVLQSGGAATPHGGVGLFSNGFLPAQHQASVVKADQAEAVTNIRPRQPQDMQRKQLDFLAEVNREHLQQVGSNSALESRIASFELAFRMQTTMPEAQDITGETEVTKKLYGMDNPVTANFGMQCLMARRFLERGVRFVQVTHSDSEVQWDQHGNLYKGHSKNAAEVDRPIAGFLKDLKSRGLLDDTLVLWGGEFGRTPTAQGTDGRDHNPHGFTMWMAGAGVKKGFAYGATDDYGYYALEDKMHIHDLHATLLHLLGMDHERLTYRFAGRDFRLTDVHGQVARDILA
jgi:hypothetical protein